MLLAEPIQIIKKLVEVFDKLHIAYFIGGSLASSLHGIPRATQDVDIVANIKNNHISPMVEALGSRFYISGEMIQEAIQRKSSFNLIHLETMFKIDVFILSENKLSQQEMRRREKYRVSDEPLQNLFLASAEDTIVHKLYWFQLGREVSDRQWNDVLGVLQVQADKIDYSYLNQTAQKRGVLMLLERALKEANTKGKSE